MLLDGKPVLSCSTPIGRADGRAVDTLERLEEEAKQFTGFFAAQGADPVSYTHLDVYKRQCKGSGAWVWILYHAVM